MANALIAAELSLSGIRQLIPFDQMLDAMYAVGKRLPAELRETALGGCAAAMRALATPAALRFWQGFLRVHDRKCRPEGWNFASFCANTPKRWPG